MKENANDKRISLITEVLSLSDEQVLLAFIGTTSEPDAETESHTGGNPHDPPPGDPPGGGQ